MKILHLMKNLQIGGVQISVLDYLSNCPSFVDNVPVENFLMCEGGILADKINKNVVYKELTLNTDNPINIVINAFKIAFYVKKQKIDILHAYNRQLSWSAYIATILLRHKVKFVTTMSGFYNFHNIFTRLISRSLILSDIIISPSKCLMERLLNAYTISRRKVRILPEGVVDETSKAPSITCLLNKLKTDHNIDIVDSESKLILCLTRISKIKGLDVLIKALPLLPDNYVCLFISPPKKDTYFKYLKQLISSLNVRAYFLDHSYKFLIKCADVIICPSTREESFGRVPVEAGLFQKIVVATNIGGFTEVINNKTGLLFQNQDHVDLAGKIDKVFRMQEHEYKEIAENAQIFAKQNFDIKNHVINKLSIYKELLEEDN